MTKSGPQTGRYELFDSLLKVMVRGGIRKEEIEAHVADLLSRVGRVDLETMS